MLNFDPMDTRLLGWSHLADIWLDHKQFRNALDRGAISLGRKVEDRGWTFSLRERFAIEVISALRAAWMPLTTAAVIAARVSVDLEALMAHRKCHGTSVSMLDGIWLETANAGDELAMYYSTNNRRWSPQDGIGEELTPLPMVVKVCLSLVLERWVRFCASMAADGEDDEQDDADHRDTSQ